MRTDDIKELESAESSHKEETKTETHGHHRSTHRSHSGRHYSRSSTRRKHSSENIIMDQRAIYKSKRRNRLRTNKADIDREKKLILKMMVFMVFAIPVLIIIFNFLDKSLRGMAD